MKIYYVTGNKGKVDLINMIYKDKDIEIIQENIETPEIQDLDCEKVASYSAKYAANILNKPVLKNDSGLVIPTLKGFPGALAKYAEETLEDTGFIKLMADEHNRECYWVEALAYCEPNAEPVVFVSKTYGTIALEPRGSRGYPYDKIFIPENNTKTFAEMSEEEQLKTFDQSAYLDLLTYLNTKKKEL